MPSENATAIVGYGYRMPGGIRSDADFWQLLSERNIVREPVTERYGEGYRPIAGFSGPSRFASPYEGLMREEEALQFDCKLFGLSSHEANYMDPQMKLLLGCTWEAFEHAGWDLYRMRNSYTGVFIGTQISAAANWRPPHGANEFIIPGTSLSMLANRISYHFNLMGPSTSYLTACSSGLSALHAAMNALRCGDCHQAVVGAANCLGSGLGSAGFNALGVISPDGKCHSFDASANGYMRSEGVFIFILKPLAAAERDGDRIHAVIAATAVNAAGTADGATGLGQGRYITAPSKHAQVELMRMACARADRVPKLVDYIEAHATGTQVGDRIEGNAIGEVFGGLERTHPLRVASVKSNVGHLEAASFHCALLKVILMMQRRQFAPISKNFLVPNPEIDFAGYHMHVQTACEAFPEHAVAIGINSFGFGGANGHCVVEEYRPTRARPYSSALHPEAGTMIPMSARTPAALVESVQRLQEVLSEQAIDLYALASNLSLRRTHFAARTSFAVLSRDELVSALSVFVQQPEPIAMANEGDQRLVMVFSGQGTQWAGCGRELYDTHPVFRRVIDAIESHWCAWSNISLREACFSAKQEHLDQCELAQPVIFAIQCALVEVLKTWGVYPDCVVGHSCGEVAAAYACGAIPLAEATRLMFYRATLQQRTAGSGRMLAVGLDRAELEKLLETSQTPFQPAKGHLAQIEIACENGPASTVICGAMEVLKPIMVKLDQRNLQNQLIPGNIAFHSSAMDLIEDDVLSALVFLDDQSFSTAVPFISSVTGLETRRLDRAYWWANIRQPVRFVSAMRTIEADHRPDIVVEVSPHIALRSSIRQCFEHHTHPPVCIATLIRHTDARISLHQTLGALFQEGVDLDFAAQYPFPEPITHLLPGHPKEERPAIDPLVDDVQFVKQGDYSSGPLIGRKVPSDHLRFEARLSAKDFPWLVDHRVQQISIMPAAGYIEIILQALGVTPVHFEVLEFRKPCPITNIPVRLQTDLESVAGAEDEFTFTISSRPYGPEAESTLHCCGTVRRMCGEFEVTAPRQLKDVDTTGFLPTRFKQAGDFYEHMDVVIGEFFQYGSYFQAVQRIDANTKTKELILDLAMDDALWADGQRDGFVLPPSLMDGALQAFLYYLMLASDFSGVPQQVKQLTVFRSPTSPRLTCHFAPPNHWSHLHEKGQLVFALGEQPCGSITLYDSITGDLVAYLGQYTSFHANPKRADVPRGKHVVSWQPKFIAEAEPILVRLGVGDIQPASLIAAIEQRNAENHYACHVIEFATGHGPDQSLLKQCLSHVTQSEAQTEFWLVSKTEDDVQAHYDAFHHHDAALRFENLDLASPSSSMFTKGLLRPAAAEILFLHQEVCHLGQEGWKLLHRFVVSGGFALVQHDEGEIIEPVAGWTTLRAGRRTTLLQAPKRYADSHADPAAIEKIPRWVIGEPGSWIEEWVHLLDAARVYPIAWKHFATGTFESLEQWPQAADLQAIDFFCGHDPQDPTGEQVAQRFVAFLQALIPYRSLHATQQCSLTVVTPAAAYQVEHPRGSVLWGAVRSLALEIGKEALLDLRLVDLGDTNDLETLAWLGRNDLRERELAVRQQRVRAPRVINIRAEFPLIPASNDHTYRLCIDHPGQITGLQMKTDAIAECGPRDVEIEIAAAALNFRDIMVTLGLLPLLSYERSILGREVGMEASGIVRRVGSSVSNRKVGDEVIFMKGGCISNRVVTDERTTFVKPAKVSMVQAASLLSVYVTAYYALIHLVRLGGGQRVLIHSAMGGVGQAAIALAKHVGAEIYATAGSQEKRDELLNLGVIAAFDSHSYSWYDDLLKMTEGEGVDVVLNSLAGHHIALCLRALRPGGWHCEIGKVDIYADNRLNLRVFRKNLRFLAIDIDRLMNDDPVLSRRLSQDCLDLISEDILPPLPVTTYAYKDYASAMRCMMNGEHQGKLVLEAPKAHMNPDLSIADARPFLDPNATYLVTGAFGGFGLRLLSFLAASGANHLTLMDRDRKRLRSIHWVRHQSGLADFFPEVEIQIVSGDVSDIVDVKRCIDEMQMPLKGVFHLAGVTDDQLLADLSAESFSRVFASKARGALNLHNATASCTLDHFVLLSSIASVFGSPGQVNYSAANAFLDGLASYRLQHGLPGLSFNMAAISEVGMAARHAHVLRMMKSGGVPAVSCIFAINGLDYAMRAMTNQDHLMTALFKHLPWTVDHPDYMRFGRLMSNQDTFGLGTGDGQTLDSVVAQITHKVAELCGHDEISMEESLSSYGLNSISVSELGAFIHKQFNHQVSALELMTTATSRSLATAIVHGQDEQGSEKSEDILQKDNPALEDALAQRRAERLPSVFANALQDHFPDTCGTDLYFIDGVAQKPRIADIAAVRQTAPGNGQMIPMLVGSLPPDCQQDLNTLRGFIHRTLSQCQPAKAVSPSEIGHVLLTGSTGFIGRFILCDLLQQRADLVVHCLVRGENAEQGFERIRTALQKAKIWDEMFASRIRVLVGDMGQPQFGLAETEFDNLCHQIDAVYHLAADLTLAAPYVNLREVNTRSIRNVLELCLRERNKHIFYASTMGVFPQYFCNFSNEFTHSQIDHQMQPDLEIMKKVFPIGVVGYPWSKLVVEQSLLFAHSAGMPVAIFRLPQTGLAVSTGFTQDGDIKVRLASAVLDVEMAPKNFVFQWTEPVDKVSALCTAITLNPDRQFTIYHCCNPEPAHHGIELSELGFNLREVSYEQFKQACQAQGKRSPLHGHWVLLDHFASYWFSADKTQAPLAISDEAIRQDCPEPIEWPGLITTTARSLQWMQRHPQQWRYTVPQGRLNFDSLITQAERYVERVGLAFEQVYPLSLRTGLQRLVQALNAPQARLLDDRRAVVNLEFCRKLRNVAELAGERERHPEIERESIDQPVFILGINRTGTTLLHCLLARDSRFWSLRPYELAQPVMPNGEYATIAGTDADPRRVYVEDLFSATGAIERLAGIHSIDIDEPEEDFALLEHTFAAWDYTARYHVPDYGQWLATTGSEAAYAYHHSTMQHFSWQRRQSQPGRDGQWLLKMPFHLMELEMLVATYPDALFIQTHRDPCQFMASWSHFLENARALVAVPHPAETIGAEQVAFMSGMLNHAVSFRDAHPELEHRWIDVDYRELIEDPLGIVRGIYAQRNWPLENTTIAAMNSWLSQQAERRRNEKRHRYTLEAYGLTTEAIQPAFASYRDFITRRGIRIDSCSV